MASNKTKRMVMSFLTIPTIIVLLSLLARGVFAVLRTNFSYQASIWWSIGIGATLSLLFGMIAIQAVPREAAKKGDIFGLLATCVVFGTVIGMMLLGFGSILELMAQKVISMI